MKTVILTKKEKTIYKDVETRLNAVLDDLKHKRIIKWTHNYFK